MSNSKKDHSGSGVSQVAKSLIVTVFKLLAIAIAFSCKVLAMLLNGISELLQKASGHGNH
jgi:hypothetical protein